MTWRGRHIFLIGLPGAGKSAIGRELAVLFRKLGYEFIDLDREIEKRAARSIPEIFTETGGEEGFRDLETEVLLDLAHRPLDQKRFVIATGGGAVLRDVNRSVMRGTGLMIWVDVTVKQATENIISGLMAGEPRPLLKAANREELEAKVRALLTERRHYYELATLHFVTRSPRGDERSPAELAQELVKALEEMSKRVRLKPRFQTLVAHSATGDYPISIGSGIAMSELASAIKDQKVESVVIVTDETVAKLHATRLQAKLIQELPGPIQLHSIAIAAGEISKDRDTLFALLESFGEIELTRRGALVIAIGGGVVTDLAGLTASLFKRGIPIIHVPTTLVGQIDAAIGGKTGINYGGVKNLLGTFYPPRLVLVDPMFLKTLPKRELYAGLGELFKYALIGSRELWESFAKAVRRLIRGVDPSYEPMIRAAIAEKLRYIADDEFEKRSGVRELLNFGHTFGHAIEAVATPGAILHGEAVLIGMRAAAWLSYELGHLEESEWRQIEIVLGRIPIEAEVVLDPKQLLEAMRRDKKRHSSNHRLILLKAIGEAFVAEDVSDDDILNALDFALSVL